jgi:hypothetical protein
MIAGGSEAAITPMGVGGFAAMRALSSRNDDPAHASRPFDKERDGFVVGKAPEFSYWKNWNSPASAALPLWPNSSVTG